MNHRTAALLLAAGLLAPEAELTSAADCVEGFCAKELSDDYSLRYKINVPDDTTADVCDGCTITMEVTYDGEAWVGFGFSTNGKMIGSEAVIGLPSEGTVEKYNLGGYSTNAVTPMPEGQQTLTEASIEVTDGKTVMTFTKIMKEDGEIEVSTGDNTFLWVHGSPNALSYHGQTRASFELNLSEGTPEEEASDPAPELETELEPAATESAPEPTPKPLAVGDDVCISGFVMDNYCIYDNNGVLLDAPRITTLENPELHSYHCLLDVSFCYESGFQVLGPKNEDTGLHCPGFRLDDTDAVLAAGRALGRKGPCTTCSGDASSPSKGYAATIKGTVKELGDGSDTVAGPPLLTDLQVLGEGVGCDGTPTLPPLCAAAPSNNCVEGFCVKEVSSDYSLRYKINVPDDTTADVCDGCTITMELTYDGEGWVGIGFSTNGRMVGSEAVIALPDEGTVEKYVLGGFVPNLVTPMPEGQQTLTDASVEVADGKTVVTFTKIMKEDGEIEISTGDNKFLAAYGAGNEFAYHGKNRAPFELNLSEGTPEKEGGDPDSGPESEPEPEPEPEPETPAAPAGPAKDCTKELCDNQLTDDLLLRYQINVPDGTTADACDGCTISMELAYNGEAWISVGFSTDGQMIGSEAVIGLPDEGTVEKYNLGGKTNAAVTPMPESQQTLTSTSIEVVDGKTVMKFTKIMKEAGEIEISTGDNTFLWAIGGGNALGYHSGGREPFQLNLSSGASEAVAVPNKSAWLAHGIMAFCAWGVFVPFAVQSSLMRDLLPKGPLWFKLHRGLNSTAFVFFIVIFVIAVAFTSQEKGTHFNNSHQKMGLAMFVMTVVQVAWAVFRPHVPEEGQEKSAARLAFEVGHRLFGVTLLACGFWQMREGISLYAIKYSVSESGEGNLGIAYWVWIGIMSALIVIGGGYFKLMKSNSLESDSEKKTGEEE